MDVLIDFVLVQSIGIVNGAGQVLSEHIRIRLGEILDEGNEQNSRIIGGISTVSVDLLWVKVAVVVRQAVCSSTVLSTMPLISSCFELQ